MQILSLSTVSGSIGHTVSSMTISWRLFLLFAPPRTFVAVFTCWALPWLVDAVPGTCSVWMLTIFFALAALLTDMPPKSANCTSLGVPKNNRCIVCRNPNDAATKQKWGRKCLVASQQASASAHCGGSSRVFAGMHGRELCSRILLLLPSICFLGHQRSNQPNLASQGSWWLVQRWWQRDRCRSRGRLRDSSR